jgi:hypothetical protein
MSVYKVMRFTTTFANMLHSDIASQHTLVIFRTIFKVALKELVFKDSEATVLKRLSLARLVG